MFLFSDDSVKISAWFSDGKVRTIEANAVSNDCQSSPTIYNSGFLSSSEVTESIENFMTLMNGSQNLIMRRLSFVGKMTVPYPITTKTLTVTSRTSNFTSVNSPSGHLYLTT
ncbi:unnamed protein product [Fraxinus pennsylvanica]|uniref:Uncharacterized protein n=1 Tax=Fraxinus pennsylvanica TaxID=56036 RepID=A0AAD2E926_9LAMI|nr:unnamed protein product [Fraxinus pennsylvanica]